MRQNRGSTPALVAAGAAALLIVAACSGGGGDAGPSAPPATAADSGMASGPATAPANGSQTTPADESGSDSATGPASESDGSAESGSGNGLADCYVEFFDGDNFSDTSFRLSEPGKYASLSDLPGADQDWTDEADSLKVGAQATVTLYEDTDFQGAAQELEAGGEYPNVDNEPSSLAMNC